MKILAMRKLVTFVLCLQVAVGTAAFASDSSPGLQGTWVGTIGSAQVRFCITADGDSSSYYYEKYQEKIPLDLFNTVPVQIKELAVESSQSSSTDVTAVMELKQHNGRLEGTWTAQSKQLKVRLKKLKHNGNPTRFNCEDIFYEPLITRFLATRKSTDASYLLLNLHESGEYENYYNPEYLKYFHSKIKESLSIRYDLPGSYVDFQSTVSLDGESSEYLSLSWEYLLHGTDGTYGAIEGLIFKKEGAKLLDSDTLLKTDAALTFDTDTEQLPKQVHALLNPCDLNRSRSYRVHTPTKIGLSFAPNSSYDPSDCGRPETIPWSEIQHTLAIPGFG